MSRTKREEDMDITYLGHAAFKLRTKDATVVTDPFGGIGFSMPSVSADIVTISHDHNDHNAAQTVTGTSRRSKPYIIKAPGEYEVAGVGVYGWGSYHDDVQGSARGKNTIYVIYIEGIRVVHLGDLGHMLDDSLIDDIGDVDIAMVPVGGHYTIDHEQAVEVVQALQPGMVIPMHYRTDQHDPTVFGELSGVKSFLKAMGDEALAPVDKLRVKLTDIPEETVVVYLQS